LDEQLLPDVSQRLHWYAYFSLVPLHVPWLAVSVPPTIAVPPIDGGTRLVGPAVEVADFGDDVAGFGDDVWVVVVVVAVVFPGGAGGFVLHAAGAKSAAATKEPTTNVNVFSLMFPPESV
jgi:hypothetical protein